MPTYDYKCPTCSVVKEVIHSITESPKILCDSCSKSDIKVVMERCISAGFFNLGSTESMAWKEKRYRVKKNARLDLKQMERYGTSGGASLVPNVGGEVTESWSDAAKLARDSGKDTLTYQKKIADEKSTSKLSGINDVKWKSAKDKI